MLLALALAAQTSVLAAPEPTARSGARLASPARALLVTRPAQEERQGWLGVNLAIDDHERPLGVSDVEGGSPAERGDLRPGDRLLALDGQALESYDTLIGLLRERGPGAEVALTVRRALEVDLDERGGGKDRGPRLGVHLGQRDEGEGARWVVRDVEAGWPAERAGVQAGDRIVRVAGDEPADFDALMEILAGVAPHEGLELVIERDLHVRLGERPGEAAPRAVPPDRFQAVPEGGGRLRLMPHGEAVPLEPAQPRAGPADLERQLREEINGLNQELRALREELRTLRRELAALRER